MNEKPNAFLTLVTVLFITATVALAACIRSVRVSDSLWVDELHTSWTVSSTLSDTTLRAAQGNQSPLYFWIQWLVQSVFGHSETALRAVSWMSGLILVIVAIFAALRLTRSRAAACTAGMLIAVDSNLVFYANEARPYALLQLVGTLSALACFQYANTETVKSRCAWIALATVSCYLHYTAGLLIAGEAVYLVCRSLTGGRLSSIQNDSRLA